MKTVSAYRAEDGSLHETREGAAVADLIVAGFDEMAAANIVFHRKTILEVLGQLDRFAHIPVYYPERSEDAA